MTELKKKRVFGKPVIRICKICKIVFSVFNYRKNTALFCSKKCLYKRNGEKIKRECLICNKIIENRPCEKERIFCSHKCHSFSTRGKININLQKAKPLLRGEKHPMWGKRHPPEILEKIKRTIEARYGKHRFKGEKSPSWRGGLTPINETIRKSKEYKEWAKAVKERDNYTCRECGERGVYLNSDHIKPFAIYPELRFSVDNGQTLCKKCHSKKTSKDMITMRKETNIWTSI